MQELLLIVALTAGQPGTVGPDRFPPLPTPPRTEESRSTIPPSGPAEGSRLGPRPLTEGRPPEAGVTERLKNPDIVLRWNQVALDLIRAERTPPPAAARNLALVHIAIYDAVTAIYQTHRPYRFEVRLREPADPIATVAIAAHRVLIDLYPRQAATLDAALDATLAGVRPGGDQRRGMDLGQQIAEKVLAWRRTDGSGRRVTFRGGSEVGVWRPTPPDYTPALLPQWSAVTPFGVRDVTSFRPPPPPSLTSAEYTRDLDEVQRLGGRDSRERSAEGTIIALFWNDGAGTVTPPGHWNQVAAVVARQEGHSLPENARLFALLNIALADAAIACWDCKYHYRLWRPITVNRLADPDWTPLLETPPFPTYTSGHSTFSGAAAAVLAYFHGTDRIRFTVGSEGWPTGKRTFASFSAAAAEAGRSRIYGGIHFEFDNRAGLAMGRKLAEEICRTQLQTTEGVSAK
jgi:membrane-associated phospholipid phosphatase